MNILFGLSILIKKQVTFAITNIEKYINNKFERFKEVSGFFKTENMEMWPP